MDNNLVDLLCPCKITRSHSWETAINLQQFTSLEMVFISSSIRHQYVENIVDLKKKYLWFLI